MISLYDILDASNGQLFGEPVAKLFTDICFDAQHAGESQLYVALKTERGDGHQYIREAIENGATGVLCTNPPMFDTENVTVVLVKDPEAALISWAHFILKRYGTHIIGVGGSSGKAITAAAIQQLLSGHISVHHRQSQYPGRLSLPYVLAKLNNTHQVVLLELEVTQPGEMAEMLQGLSLDVGVVTHGSLMHGDHFSSADDVTAELNTLVQSVTAAGRAIINYDDDQVRMLGMTGGAPALTYSLERFGADLLAYNIVPGLTGTGFDVQHRQKRYIGRWTPLLGKHQLYGLMAALLVGEHYGVSLESSLKTIKTMDALPGCMNPLRGVNGATFIDDTYDADPFATQMALDWLKLITQDGYRTIFVMGDMDDLGAYSQRAHRLVGQSAARSASVFITEGTEAALASRAAIDEGMSTSSVHITYSASDVVIQLKSQLQPNDIVLVKGGAASRMGAVVQSFLADKRDTALLRSLNADAQALVSAPPIQPSWVEIDLDALAHNVRRIKEMIGEKVSLMSVVKADAYGAGAVAASRTALLNGAAYLAVASISEALELRSAGITAPILTLSYVPPHAIQQALRQNITITLYDLELTRTYERILRETRASDDEKLRVHVKIDTGMGRLGILAAEATTFFRHFMNFGSFDLEGIYTHFASADDDPDYTAEQVRVFTRVVNSLRAGEFKFRYIHAANSAGMLASKNNHFNMVRVGLAMHGVSPSAKVRVPDDFRPVLTWKTVVAQIKTLPPGYPVGYGSTYRTRGEERIAILPVGYSDGLRRAPNNWGHVLIHGEPAPLVGRVSMEKTAINVTHIPGVSIGDEVVLLGRQGDSVISADEIAQQLGTISYEVLTTILPRQPRR